MHHFCNLDDAQLPQCNEIHNIYNTLSVFQGNSVHYLVFGQFSKLGFWPGLIGVLMADFSVHILLVNRCTNLKRNKLNYISQSL